MPKAGVGIFVAVAGMILLIAFQSIYAQSGRWNLAKEFLFQQRRKFVSIHLCPKRALEFGKQPLLLRLQLFRFNPSMPKAGVGMAFSLLCLMLLFVFQSIYAQSGRWN